MNHLARAAFAIAFVGAAIGLTGTAPARADANAAVCAQGYGKLDGLSCDYVSFDQCRASISGTPATCVTNPYLRAAQNTVVRPRERRRY